MSVETGIRDFDRSWVAGFREVERSGFRLQLKVRAAVLLVVAAWFFVTTMIERALIYAAFFLILVMIGWAAGRLVARLSAKLWRLPAAALILLDVTMLSIVLASPGLLPDHDWPPQMALRFFSFLYLLLYVMGSALTTSPLLVMWTGVTATITWSACVWWIMAQPDTITTGSVRISDTNLPTADQLEVWLDPHFVSVVSYRSQALTMLLGSAVLAIGVWRSRRVLFERARIAAERQSLARFVPADLADDLAAGPALGTVRRQPVAVVFADIVGYTTMAERLTPEAALALLGEFHGRLATVVREHGGTVDKFIGDAVMATFGTSGSPMADYAARALRCAIAAVDVVDLWNRERVAAGGEPVQAGIGLHCGEALVGTVGAQERFEHTVVGDVVNVASRLEQLTREHGTPLLVSEAVFADAGPSGIPREMTDRFASTQTFQIRGRAGGIRGRALKAR